jgi:hypothetical protein
VTAEIPSYLSLAYDKEVAVEVVKDGAPRLTFSPGQMGALAAFFLIIEAA